MNLRREAQEKLAAYRRKRQAEAVAESMEEELPLELRFMLEMDGRDREWLRDMGVDPN